MVWVHAIDNISEGKYPKQIIWEHYEFWPSFEGLYRACLSQHQDQRKEMATRSRRLIKVTSFIAFHIINSTSNNARLPEAGHEHHEAKCLEKEIVCTSGGSTLDDGGNDTGVEEYHHGIENEEARTVVELEHVVIHENLRDER